MKNTTKFGAVLIGLIFLLSLIAVPVAAETQHKIVIVPAQNSGIADEIKVFDTAKNIAVGDKLTDVSPGTTYFYLYNGNYRADLYQGPTLKTSQAFTVSDTSSATVYYNIGSVAVPSTPVLTASAGATTVDLSWTYSGATVDSFKIFRNNVEIQNIKDSTARTYSDASLSPATSYAYQIIAYNAGGQANSDTISVTTLAVNANVVYVSDLNFDDQTSPGQTTTFALELENSAPTDMNHVKATVVVKNLANSEDTKVTVDYGTIASSDTKSQNVAIDIPANADSGDHLVVVNLKWSDQDGKEYTNTYTATDKLTIIRADHQVLLTTVQTDATTYKAGDTVQIAATMINSGAHDEIVKLAAVSDANVQVAGPQFTLKEGDSTTQYLTFALPANAKAGNYYVVVSAVYNGVSSIQKFVLSVNSNTPVQAQQSTVTVVQPATQTSTPLPTTEIALGAIVLILAGIIAWFGKDVFSKGAAKPIIIKARGK